MTPKIGIQLIIYGKRPQEDLNGVLAEVHRAGYDGVEMGRHSWRVQDLSNLLRENQLLLSGFHTGYADLANEATRRDMINALPFLGGRYLVCSGVADAKRVAGYEEAGALFNRVGDECRQAGLTFCYHNHAWEFQPLEGGVKGIHRLAEVTDPALVKFNIDIYWVHIGGEDPAEFIRRYANRGGYYHVKDGRPGEFLPLGTGEVNLRAAVEAALLAGADWFVYEQDRPKEGPYEDSVTSIEYLKTLGIQGG